MTINGWIMNGEFSGREYVEVKKNEKVIFKGTISELKLSKSIYNMTADKFEIKTDCLVFDVSDNIALKK